MDLNKLSSEIISAAIEVHKALGPGLLESAYEECLCHELNIRGLSFERQKQLPGVMKGTVMKGTVMKGTLMKTITLGYEGDVDENYHFMNL